MNNKETYRQLCRELGNIPLFLQDWWLDVVCPAWDAAIVYNGDAVAGVWPYNAEQKAGVSIIRTPLLTPYIGPYIFFPHDLKESKKDNFEYEATAALLEKLPAAKVWNIALWPGSRQVGLFTRAGLNVQPRQTFLMPLQEEEANIFSRLNEDYRRNIRKAEKDIQVTEEPENMHILASYLKSTLRRKEVNMHYSTQLMQQLFDVCRAHNAGTLWTARRGTEIQAVLWHVWDKEKAYYLAGSRNPAVKDSRAMTALIWHAIKEANKAGKKTFDFEGSMDAGVEKFFRNFGAERELYLVVAKNDSLLWKVKNALL